MTISIDEAVQQALAAHERGELATARKGYENILAFDERCSEARHLLGVLNYQTGQSQIAVEMILKALAFVEETPNGDDQVGKLARYNNNLGLAYLELGEKVEAERRFRMALKYDPNQPAVWCNLARLIHQSEFHEEAAEAWQQVIRLEGVSAESGSYWNNLGNCFLSQGENDQAFACFEKAMAHSPNESGYYSNWLMTSLYDPKFDDATLKRLHEAWDRRYAPTNLDAANRDTQGSVPTSRDAQASGSEATTLSVSSRDAQASGSDSTATPYPPACAARLQENARLQEIHQLNDQRSNLTETPRKLRIGYVSPDFRGHAINSFFEAFYSAHDRERFEFYLYGEVRHEDEISRRLASQAAGWCNTTQLDDAAMAARIRADRIDILIDLAGHTAGGSLRVFAMKPAPIQISYLGYPHATGLSSIPYRIVDSVLVPLEENGLLRIDPCFCCYRPNYETPEVAAPPCVQNGFITFGSLHGMFRLNDRVIDLWSEVLRAVPNSRMYCFRNTLRGKAREKLRRRFLDRGITADRLDLNHEFDGTRSHFDLYRHVDITLDTFPWSGHTTCCESLWMGTPVVTLDAGRQSSRMAASVLQAVGQADWIAKTPRDFIRIAADLANDRVQLIRQRAELREQVLASPLCDYRGFAAKLEQLFNSLWSTHSETATGVSKR